MGRGFEPRWAHQVNTGQSGKHWAVEASEGGRTPPVGHHVGHYPQSSAIGYGIVIVWYPTSFFTYSTRVSPSSRISADVGS